ncbi:TSC complex subunit 1a isoform X3 [Eleginops maclovinus]|uniref:TSC complex subunit 1a isoform X3 n=2 Tax=Eleginops maclovinus TaxID=56733 RepID=UPI0030809C86
MKVFFTMSNQQLSIGELLLSLDSSDLQEAELVRAAVNQQLSSDRGGAVLSSLVEFYLDSSSSQVLLLLSSIREHHHKPLLEKLNEALSRSGSRLPAVTLLGHLIRKQPPWVHTVSRSPLLPSLLRQLKTETDVVFLITAVLVLITLLPMIPQAGKQHIYDFFDVFGRLASWSYRNPGHVPVEHLVHLQAGVYSLFHRLYGMFPCNFMSYLRLHYSMKENLDVFQEVVKPMLEHVRVHPELVTGTQDYELDPSRWRCYEVHDIVIECSRVSLDPLDSSCEEDAYSSLREPPPSPSPLPHLNLTCSQDTISSSAGSSVCPLLTSSPLTLSSSDMQVDDVTWSPSSQCGLSTPPPEPAAPGPAPPLSRTTSISGVKCSSSATVQVVPLAEEIQHGGQTPDNNTQVKLFAEQESIQPIPEEQGRGQNDDISSEGDQLMISCADTLLTSTPARPPAVCHTPPHRSEGSPAPSYEPLFELALPRAASLFIGRKTQEALERAAGGGGGERKGEEEELTSISPLQALDQLIVHGYDAHHHLSRRLSAASRSVDRSHFGGKQQSMKTKEELQALSSQLLLLQAQLQYERFKRQQHAVRNRRLLRRVLSSTAMEEDAVAMKGQLCVQDEEIRSLKCSLQEEQRRYTLLQQDTQTHTEQLHTHIQQLLLQQQEVQRDTQRLKSELKEGQNRLREQEAELQRANNKASHAEHQLTQLSLKLCSSEQLQQQIYLLNQQLVLMRETNRALTEHLEGRGLHRGTEVSMLQCTVGKEHQRLKDSDVLQRQKLEAANHRASELEVQLSRKEQLILDQKKLLEDSKARSRAELSACESRCDALRRVVQTLQTETLHLYSQLHLDTHSRPQDVRPNGSSVALPAPHKPRPFSSSVGILNGGTLSTSPLYLPSCSSSPPLSLSPIDSPLAVGSFLEQRARQLFRPTNHSAEEEHQEEEEGEGEEEEVQPEGPALGQEAEETPPLTGSTETPGLASSSGPAAPLPADLTFAVRQRRHELSIMDYDETQPEF